ncbi:MAG: hypothetical protein ABW202_02220 [Duganella sp.]
MTMPIKIDTLEYAKRLAEAGLPSDQAEAQAHSLSDVLSEAAVSPSELVLLKADLLARMELIRHELRSYTDALGVELNHRIDGVEAKINALAKKFDTMKWMIGGVLVLQAMLVLKVFWVA